jgi:hypothetical protein
MLSSFAKWQTVYYPFMQEHMLSVSLSKCQAYFFVVFVYQLASVIIVHICALLTSV